MYNAHTDILLAGAIAAFSVDVLVYPLDTLKTRFQSPDYHRLYRNRTLLYRGLYQGLGSVVIATVPASGAFFTTYEGTKAFLHAHNPTSPHGTPYVPTALVHGAASATAELVSCAILTPAEVIKQNAQMVQGSASSSTSSTNATLQTLRRFQHPAQLWRGYFALAARNLPFTAMHFPLFEHLRMALVASRERAGLQSDTVLHRGAITAVSAGAAGAVAAVLTTPVDVVKTRIMLAAGETRGAVHALAGSAADKEKAGNRPGAYAIGRQILRAEGVRGLWRGGLLRGAWTAMGSGLYLGIYEAGRIWLGASRSGLDDF
ncbi:MAG: hypothetical protein M1838_004258 [Thelocarpon superellum]|nr:MAG: hypothetical protein M1838_004258 [Thelocarpon superellum]